MTELLRLHRRAANRHGVGRARLPERLRGEFWYAAPDGLVDDVASAGAGLGFPVGVKKTIGELVARKVADKIGGQPTKKPPGGGWWNPIHLINRRVCRVGLAQKEVLAWLRTQ